MRFVVPLLVVAAGSCASGAVRASVPQRTGTDIVLAPGVAQRAAGSDLTLTFEGVSDDSRCPSGVTCVWEGDATVRIRIESAALPTATHSLHTHDSFPRAVDYGDWRLHLESLVPIPGADGPPRPDDYRATILIQRK